MNELKELYKLIHHGAITEAKKLCAKLALEPEATQFGYRQFETRVRAFASEVGLGAERSYTVEALGQRGARDKAEKLYRAEFEHAHPYVWWIQPLPTEDELKLREEARVELERLDGLELLPPDVKWEVK